MTLLLLHFLSSEDYELENELDKECKQRTEIIPQKISKQIYLYTTERRVVFLSLGKKLCSNSLLLSSFRFLLCHLLKSSSRFLRDCFDDPLTHYFSPVHIVRVRACLNISSFLRFSQISGFSAM